MEIQFSATGYLQLFAAIFFASLCLWSFAEIFNTLKMKQHIKGMKIARPVIPPSAEGIRAQAKPMADQINAVIDQVREHLERGDRPPEDPDNL